MAINRATHYGGRWTASPGQPDGGFINRTGVGAADGSYIEKDWANDWAAFFSSLLVDTGEVANGTVDEVGSSQLYSALLNLIVPLGQPIFRVDATHPSTIYPGTTWESVGDGRYIAAVGEHTDLSGNTVTLNPGDIAAGEYLHELTETEMPAHSHGVSGVDSSEAASGSSDPVPKGTVASGLTGGGDAHNNMPPGFAMYCWVRTA